MLDVFVRALVIVATAPRCFHPSCANTWCPTGVMWLFTSKHAFIQRSERTAGAVYSTT